MMLGFLIALLATDPHSARGPSLEVPVSLPADLREPRLVVIKSRRELQLHSGDELLRTYRVGLGREPVRPKERQGDFATPEGTYYVCVKNPQSKYELALGLSYPGPADADRGFAEGIIDAAQRKQILAAWRRKAAPPWNTPLGGAIMIHGKGSDADWTAGCVALDNEDIHELYRVIPVGTRVEIRP
jgi:murein L,D-transpeptidase YafK